MPAKKNLQALPVMPLIQIIDEMATDPIAKMFLYAALVASLAHMIKSGYLVVEEEKK